MEAHSVSLTHFSPLSRPLRRRLLGRLNSVELKPLFFSPLSTRYKSLFLPLNSYNLRIRCVTNHDHYHHFHDHGHDHDHHNHNHDHDHPHPHFHPHHHHHHHGSGQLNGPQRAVIGFAKAIRWMDLANYLREHLLLCCCATALFIAAAACPYLVPKPTIKPLQNSFLFLAFPLVGVSAALDAIIDIAGGKVNIHVLMALAAFASVFMGNASFFSRE